MVPLAAEGVENSWMVSLAMIVNIKENDEKKERRE
jgi:hypothetical protein